MLRKRTFKMILITIMIAMNSSNRCSSSEIISRTPTLVDQSVSHRLMEVITRRERIWTFIILLTSNIISYLTFNPLVSLVTQAVDTSRDKTEEVKTKIWRM